MLVPQSLRGPHRIALLLLAAAVLGGCDESGESVPGGGGAGATSGTTVGATSTSGVSTSTTSSGTSSATATTGTGGDLDLSECQTDADCPGGTCVDVNQGFKLCKTPVLEATSCSDPEDACCNTTDCPTGEKCVAGPATAHCGGAQPSTANLCVKDQCVTDADCPGGVCAPAGTVGNQMSVCVSASCFGTFCGQESLSPCALLRDPCCNAVPVGFYCVQDCHDNADCPDGYCELDAALGHAVCKRGSAPCPP